MIQNDQELKVTRDRISYLFDLLARLRASCRPEELGLVSGGYRAEVERMQKGSSRLPNEAGGELAE